MPTVIASPDINSRGLLAADPDPLRYDGHSNDPYEVAGILSRLAPEGGRILDVGCGTGSVSLIVANGSKSAVVGIEPDGARAKVAGDRGLEVIHGSLTPELRDTLGKFDCVLFADVLEHTANPSQLIATAAQFMSEHGILLLSVPNVAHWTVRLNLMMGRWRYESSGIMDATHLRWFTSESIEELCRQAGFKVEKHCFTAGTTLPVYLSGWGWRSLPHRFRISMIRFLVKVCPTLFGCQHVIKARRSPQA